MLYSSNQFSMVSLLVKEKFYINEVVLGTAFGIILGPYVADIFDPRAWSSNTHTITREVMRIVLATGLFAIGVELPKSYMAKHVKGLIVMVVPTMAIGWVIVAGGKYAKKHVPLNLRQILSAESAANDGLAFPFLSISLYLILEHTRGEAIELWVLVGWLYQVIMGVVIGAILGLMFSHVMKFSLRKGFIDRESYVAQYLALAIFISGVVSTIGSDDLLAAFAAGSAISWDGEFNDHTEGEVFASMGVGAIFISSLALSKLPTPHNPPQNQEELLAASLEAIVAFGIADLLLFPKDGLSIPFFSLTKNTLSLTNTINMTNTLTNMTPDWLLGMRTSPQTIIRNEEPSPVEAEAGEIGPPQLELPVPAVPPMTRAEEMNTVHFAVR
ncbi:hypothetical protein H0H92_005600 [Tricholoma furcatifolium]|nr:hypothetical protein H0H92_005600 [Tricholoma furcatifolium]